MKPELFDVVLRQDLLAFTQKCFETVLPGETFLSNWHLEAIAWHLEECYRGNIRRLIITLPPRSLKSIMASVAFPAWVLGHDPGRRIICISYSSDLSSKHAGDTRRVMERRWYGHAFPRTRLGGRNRELDFNTTAGGYRFATSIGRTLTGRGGNLIIIDDSLKPDDALSDTKRRGVNEWYGRTLLSRLDNKADDVIIVIQQRLHMEDLVGHLLEQESGWAHLNLPAIAEEDQIVRIGRNRIHERKAGDLLHPAREPQTVLDELRRSMGSFAFSAQYQQNPLPIEGELIHWNWFGSYTALPARKSGDRIYQSWDTASKGEEVNDYSVCTTWLQQGNLFYLIDVYRAKLNYPDLRRKVGKLAERHRPYAILIEDKGSGTSLIQEFKFGPRGNMPVPIGITPKEDKVTRLSTQSAKIEAGQVLLPDKAPWLEALKAEILQFPHGRHDDQVDSISQFLQWIDDRSRNIWTQRSMFG